MSKSKRNSSLSGGCLTLFGLPFLIPGLVSAFICFNGYRNWLAVQSWVETPCWIETAELKTSHNDGTTYRSSAVSIHGGSDNVGDFQQDAYRELAQYAESLPDERKNLRANPRKVNPFRCYVNPREPGQAVIYRILRWPLQAFLSIFAMIFTPVGACLVFGGLWGKRILRAEEQLSPPTDFTRDFPISKIPFSFAVPIGAYESSLAGDTEYQRKVMLKVPGTAVNACFEVLVFHSDASRAVAAASPQVITGLYARAIARSARGERGSSEI